MHEMRHVFEKALVHSDTRHVERSEPHLMLLRRQSFVENMNLFIERYFLSQPELQEDSITLLLEK